MIKPYPFILYLPAKSMHEIDLELSPVHQIVYRMHRRACSAQYHHPENSDYWGFYQTYQNVLDALIFFTLEYSITDYQCLCAYAQISPLFHPDIVNQYQAKAIRPEIERALYPFLVEQFKDHKDMIDFEEWVERMIRMTDDYLHWFSDRGDTQ